MITHQRAHHPNGAPYTHFETFDVLEDGQLVATIQCVHAFRGIMTVPAAERVDWIVWRGDGQGQINGMQLGQVRAPNPSRAAEQAVQMVRAAAESADRETAS